MLLATTTQTLELVLGTAQTTTAMSIVVDYVETTSTTHAASQSNSSSNGTTAVTILSAPAASTQRKVNVLSVYNADSLVKTVTIRLNDNGTIRPLVKVDLHVGELLGYSDIGGWYVLDSSGALHTTLAATVSNLADTIHAAIAKTTPVTADEFGIWDSVALALSKVTWGNIVTTLSSTFAALAGSVSQAFSALSLGIGGAVNAADAVTIVATPSTGTAANGISNRMSYPVTATTVQRGFNATVSGADGGSPYTSSEYNAYYLPNYTLGANQTLTNQYGVRIGGLTSGTNNYGVYSGVSDAAGRWFLYSAGTAPGAMLGRLLLGSLVDDGINILQITGDTTSTGYVKNTSKVVTTTNSLTTATISTSYRYFTGTAGASFAITMPAGAAAIDGVLITIMSTAARASTTWISSGATFVGAPTSLTANTPVKLQYHHATLQWFITA